MASKIEKSSRKTEKKASFTPFDKENVVRPLKLFISIVPYGQGDGLVKLAEQAGATFSYITNGEGTGRNYLPGLLSVSDIKKQVVFTIIKEDNAKEFVEILEQRFSTSKAAKGISLSVKLTSVVGVSVYRILSNTRKVKKVQSDGEF